MNDLRPDPHGDEFAVESSPGESQNLATQTAEWITMTSPASTMASERLIASDVCSIDLEETSHPGMWVESGWPVASTAHLAQFGDQKVSVWEVSEGTVADIENDELVIVLSGSGSLSFDDGRSYQLTAGACIRLRAADRSTWRVSSPVRALLVSMV